MEPPPPQGGAVVPKRMLCMLPSNLVAALWPQDMVLRGTYVNKEIRLALVSNPAALKLTVRRIGAGLHYHNTMNVIREAMDRFSNSNWTASVAIWPVLQNYYRCGAHARDLVHGLGAPITSFECNVQRKVVTNAGLFSLFNRATNLEKFSLHTPDVDANARESPFDAVKGLHKLKAFELTNAHLSPRQYMGLADALTQGPASQLTSLGMVCIGDNKMDYIPPGAQYYKNLLETTTSLVTLDLSAWCMGGADFVSMLTPCTQYSGLTTLSLSLVNDHDKHQLALLSSITPLETLSLHCVHLLPSETVTALASLPELSKLTVCGHDEVFQGEMHVGEAMARLPHLKELHMLCYLQEDEWNFWSAGFAGAVNNNRLAVVVCNEHSFAHMAGINYTLTAERIAQLTTGVQCECHT